MISEIACCALSHFEKLAAVAKALNIVWLILKENALAALSQGAYFYLLAVAQCAPDVKLLERLKGHLSAPLQWRMAGVAEVAAGLIDRVLKDRRGFARATAVGEKKSGQ